MRFVAVFCLVAGLCCSASELPHQQEQEENVCGRYDGNSLGKIIVHQSEEQRWEFNGAVTRQATALLLMLNAAASNSTFTFTTGVFAPFGHYVTSVMGVAPNATAGEYWALCLNGRKADCGITTLRVRHGDEVAFKLKTYHPNRIRGIGDC